jgi:hypothetical protein
MEDAIAMSLWVTGRGAADQTYVTIDLWGEGDAFPVSMMRICTWKYQGRHCRTVCICEALGRGKLTALSAIGKVNDKTYG